MMNVLNLTTSVVELPKLTLEDIMVKHYFCKSAKMYHWIL